MDEATKVRVFQLVGKVTGRRIDHIDLNEDLKSQFELDSIQIVELFAALEKEFNIELPLSLLTVKTGASFFKVLEEQLNK
jgi:acyl carrier protein